MSSRISTASPRHPSRQNPPADHASQSYTGPSMSHSRARLGAVKTLRFAPPALRAAHGLDRASSSPGRLLSMARLNPPRGRSQPRICRGRPDSDRNARPTITPQGSAHLTDHARKGRRARLRSVSRVDCRPTTMEQISSNLLQSMRRNCCTCFVLGPGTFSESGDSVPAKVSDSGRSR